MLLNLTINGSFVINVWSTRVQLHQWMLSYAGRNYSSLVSSGKLCRRTFFVVLFVVYVSGLAASQIKDSMVTRGTRSSGECGEKGVEKEKQKHSKVIPSNLWCNVLPAIRDVHTGKIILLYYVDFKKFSKLTGYW